MGFHYVVAVPEARLSSLSAGGVTLTKVRGFGDYRYLYSRDWLSEHEKVEAFAEASTLDALLEALPEMAHADGPGSGVVAVMPIDRILQLRTGSDARSRCSNGCATRRPRLPATACRAIAPRSSFSRFGENSAQVPRKPQ